MDSAVFTFVVLHLCRKDILLCPQVIISVYCVCVHLYLNSWCMFTYLPISIVLLFYYCLLIRRTPGGRKLWESKDDRKWGHDKFEEMTMQDRHYEEVSGLFMRIMLIFTALFHFFPFNFLILNWKLTFLMIHLNFFQGRRNSKGNYRARGKSRGADHGYARGNRSKAYNNHNNNNNNNMSINNTASSTNNQNQAPRSVRGRGPRRYEPPARNKSETPPSQKKQWV